MGGATVWLWWGIVLVAAGCSHTAHAPRDEALESWEDTIRYKGGDSATLRIQVLITQGELEQAEALLVQAIAAGLVTQTAAEQLRERLAERKQQQSSDPKRPLPPIEPSPDEPPAERRSCWTELPGHPVCQQLPEEYAFHSAGQAFEAMKQRLGAKNLVLHKPDSAESGPCEGIGEHFNVRMNGKRAGSITCCPCCVETTQGPLQWTKCRIVW